MTNLKRLAVSFTLMFVLAVAAFAGEMPTPPTAPGETNTPPCGEMNAPPCSSASVTSGDAAVPGEIPTPPTSYAVDVSSIAEAVAWSLMLF